MSSEAIEEIFRSKSHDKHSRDGAIRELRHRIVERSRQLTTFNVAEKEVSKVFEALVKEVMRDLILRDNVR